MELEIYHIDRNLDWQTSLQLTLRKKTSLSECDGFYGSKFILYFALF